MSKDEIGRIQWIIGAFGAAVIRLWLRLFGRRVRKSEVPWLAGLIGPKGSVGEEFYEQTARQKSLTLHRNRTGAGLIPDFDVLAGPQFDVAEVDSAVRHFYERTAEYRLDVWSETRFPARLFLWLLVSTVSRYMNQLNFPVHGLEMSRGMTSDIVELCDGEGNAVHTGWFRKVLSSNRVIYTGFYTTDQPPGYSSPCVKVVFPLPSGNATVFLRPGRAENGRFTLESSGACFGEPGFYRLLEVDEDHWKVRYIRTLKEFFEVYRDDEGVLRCDHRVAFLGMTMLRLHYRMVPKGSSPADASSGED